MVKDRLEPTIYSMRKRTRFLLAQTGPVVIVDPVRPACPNDTP